MRWRPVGPAFGRRRTALCPPSSAPPGGHGLLPERPEITVDLLVEAARTFPARTGLGWDGMHPQACLRLPTAALEALCRILTHAEETSQWPKVVGATMVVLIPKTDGGRRPIGLLPMAIRWWMRARLRVAQKWQMEHDHVFFLRRTAKRRQGGGLEAVSPGGVGSLRCSASGRRPQTMGHDSPRLGEGF